MPTNSTKQTDPVVEARKLGYLSCDKCRRLRKRLYAYMDQRWCGTCISRYERWVNTQEMYGHGRRGY